MKNGNSCLQKKRGVLLSIISLTMICRHLNGENAYALQDLSSHLETRQTPKKKFSSAKNAMILVEIATAPAPMHAHNAVKIKT
jgi:hypothetical protein